MIHQMEIPVDNEQHIWDLVLGKPLKEAVFELEGYLLTQAMKANQFNQKKAARALGLTAGGGALQMWEPGTGLEPVTPRLQGERSTS